MPNAPLELKTHLLDPKDAPNGLGSLLDPKDAPNGLGSLRAGSLHKHRTLPSSPILTFYCTGIGNVVLQSLEFQVNPFLASMCDSNFNRY